MLVAERSLRGRLAAVLCGLMIAGCAANEGGVGTGDGTATETGATDPLAQNPDLMGFIFFEHGSARLDAQALSDLRQIAAYQKRTGDRLRVYGHASSRARPPAETARYLVNFRMSSQRTQVVTGALERFGVPLDKIWTASVADNWSGSLAEYRPGEAGDRHVVITREPANTMQTAPATPTAPDTGMAPAAAAGAPTTLAPTGVTSAFGQTPTAQGTHYQSISDSLTTSGTMPPVTATSAAPQSVIYQDPTASSATGGIAGPTERRHKPYFRR